MTPDNPNYETWIASEIDEEPDEIWWPIKGYEGLYEASTTGKVRSCEGTRYSRELIQGKRAKGLDYRVVTLCKDKIKKTYSVHRLIAITFLLNDENKPTVNHIDGDPGNNHVDNLEWATMAEQNRHAFDVLGKQPWNKGQNNRRGEATCENCGTRFIYPYNVRRFCTKSCSAKWRIKTYPKTAPVGRSKR